MLTLNDSTVTSNIGGRISSSNQSLTLNNSTVGENVASSCAGISGDNDSTVLTNSTVTRNIASSNGGGSATAPSGKVRPSWNGSSAVDRNAATKAMSIRL